MKILLLAGTSDARALATRLVAMGDVRAIASLSGATDAPAPYPCETRIGGFGGAEGLAAWMRTERIDAIIDATHPFASHISWNAAWAAQSLAVPRLRVSRPAWRPGPGDAWRSVPDLETAAREAPAGARLFLAVGRGGLAPFSARRDLTLVARGLSKAPPACAAPLTWIAAEPGATADAEEALFTAHGVEALVAKNAGGPADAKLEAARRLGLVVWMVERPPEPSGDAVETVEAAMAWTRAQHSMRVSR